MAQVFVIEDNPEVRKVLMMVLQRAGHEANAIGEGDCDTALEQALKSDVIILDLELYKVNSWTILQQFRELSTPKHVPVIGITTQLHLPESWAQDPNGFVAVLEKPFDISDLLHCIDRTIEYHAEHKAVPKMIEHHLERGNP